MLKDVAFQFFLTRKYFGAVLSNIMQDFLQLNQIGQHGRSRIQITSNKNVNVNSIKQFTYHTTLFSCCFVSTLWTQSSVTITECKTNPQTTHSVKILLLISITPMDDSSSGTFIFGKYDGWKCFGSDSHSTVAFCHKDILVAASRNETLFTFSFLFKSFLFLDFRVHNLSKSSSILKTVILKFLCSLSLGTKRTLTLFNRFDNSFFTISKSSLHSTANNR